MEKITCNVCTKDNPNFILNCGCSLCSNCYEVVRSFIEGDQQKCYSCDKDIIFNNNKNRTFKDESTNRAG